MNAVLQDIVPFKGQRFGFAEAGKQEQFVEDFVDRIVHPFNLIPPSDEIVNDRSRRSLLKPLDRNRRGFREIVDPSGMVPDGAKVFQ